MDDTKILKSRIDDIISALNRGRIFDFTYFLNYEQASLVISYLSFSKIKYRCFGGFEESERVIIAPFSEYEPSDDDFPIVPISFEVPSKVEIIHRDVLGALMSLGIKREMIGDIIFFENICVVFSHKKICQYLISKLVSVKNIKIKPYVYEEKIEFIREFDEISVISSSMRIDCLISEIIFVSRTKASELIEGGLVFLNGNQCCKKDRIVSENDIISIRKKGKYRVASILGKTKKDRIKLQILKYK